MDKTEPRRVFSGAPWEAKVGYARAVRVGPHVWVTGCAPVTDGAVVHAGDAEAQAARCIAVIAEALAGLDAGLRHVVRTRMFVTNIQRDWEAIGRAHAAAFGAHPPATAMVEVKSLIDPDMLVEIEADAFVPD